MKKILLLLSASILLYSCNSPKMKNPEDKESKEIEIGQNKIKVIGYFTVNGKNYLISNYDISNNKYYTYNIISDADLYMYGKLKKISEYKYMDYTLHMYDAIPSNVRLVYKDSTIISINETIILN